MCNFLQIVMPLKSYRIVFTKESKPKRISNRLDLWLQYIVMHLALAMSLLSLYFKHISLKFYSLFEKNKILNIVSEIVL